MHAQRIDTGMVSQETAATMMPGPTQPAMAPSVHRAPPEAFTRPSAVEDLEPQAAAKRKNVMSTLKSDGGISKWVIWRYIMQG